MSTPPTLTITDFVPGGIRNTDHVHIRTDDGTCSRCRVFVPEEQVPLLLMGWSGRVPAPPARHAGRGALFEGARP